MVCIDGSLFFGAVSHVAERLRDMEKKDRTPRHLVIIGSGMNFVDVAGAELLVQEAQRLRRDGREFYLFRLKSGAKRFLEQGGYLAEIGEDNVFESKGIGVKGVIEKLDKERCASCTARIFADCPASAEADDRALPK